MGDGQLSKYVYVCMWVLARMIRKVEVFREWFRCFLVIFWLVFFFRLFFPTPRRISRLLKARANGFNTSGSTSVLFCLPE